MRMQRALQTGIRGISNKYPVCSVSIRRRFAREAKKSYEAPPEPPSSTIDAVRWPLLLGLSGGIIYISMMPSNDHGLFSTEKLPQQPPANQG